LKAVDEDARLKAAAAEETQLKFIPQSDPTKPLPAIIELNNSTQDVFNQENSVVVALAVCIPIIFVALIVAGIFGYYYYKKKSKT